MSSGEGPVSGAKGIAAASFRLSEAGRGPGILAQGLRSLYWIPAFAGTTEGGVLALFRETLNKFQIVIPAQTSTSSVIPAEAGIHAVVAASPPAFLDTGLRRCDGLNQRVISGAFQSGMSPGFCQDGSEVASS